MKSLRSNRAQSTAEYAVVIAIVLGAVVGMQTYVKRGLQAKFKKATEKLTSQTGSGNPDLSLSTTGQYEPYYAESHVQTDSNTDSAIKETYAGTAAGFGLSRSGTIRDIKRGDADGKAAKIENDGTSIAPNG